MSNDQGPIPAPMTDEEYAAAAAPVCRARDVDGMDDVNWCKSCDREWEELVRVVGFREIPRRRE